MDQTVADLWRMGISDCAPVAVSAATAEGLPDLFAALQPILDARTASNATTSAQKPLAMPVQNRREPAVEDQKAAKQHTATTKHNPEPGEMSFCWMVCRTCLPVSSLDGLAIAKQNPWK
jgi:hypothetical protein